MSMGSEHRFMFIRLIGKTSNQHVDCIFLLPLQFTLCVVNDRHFTIANNNKYLISLKFLEVVSEFRDNKTISAD